MHEMSGQMGGGLKVRFHGIRCKMQEPSIYAGPMRY
jgi:hypothetical protein